MLCLAVKWMAMLDQHEHRFEGTKRRCHMEWSPAVSVLGIDLVVILHQNFHSLGLIPVSSRVQRSVEVGIKWHDGMLSLDE